MATNADPLGTQKAELHRRLGDLVDEFIRERSELDERADAVLLLVREMNSDLASLDARLEASLRRGEEVLAGGS